MRTREEQIESACQQIEQACRLSNVYNWLSGQILEAERRAEQSVRAEIEASLKDPTTVHVNMLRGSIATPGWEQFLHLFPKERAEIGRDSERLGWLAAQILRVRKHAPYQPIIINGTYDPGELRDAIDAEREKK